MRNIYKLLPITYWACFTGELTRERNIRARILLHEAEHGCITGLFFKTINSHIILFAAAKNAIVPFDVTNKDKEMKVFNMYFKF